MRSRITRLGIAAALLLVTGTAVRHLSAAEIGGRISDSTGAVIPDARVTVISEDRGIRHHAASNERGFYSVPFLDPGRYRVSVECEGFRPMSMVGVKVDASQRARVDFIVELSVVVESVEIIHTTPLLDTESATLGHTIRGPQIQQLPLNGRNYQTLALLMAGITPTFFHRDRAGGFNSHGQAAHQNNFIIDGADNNSYGFAFEDRKAQVVIPSLDAVQEFKLETSNYSAEFGRFAGAVMIVTTRAGTNELHGAL